jgi:hypothetical protein
MDGILVAYHNTRKIFGFQYITREEMDKRLFGSSRVGNKVFTNSLSMFNDVLDRATKKYPEQTLRISFDTIKMPQKDIGLRIFVEVATGEPNLAEEPYDQITLFEMSTCSYINGIEQKGPLKFKKPSKDHWTTRYAIVEKDAVNEDTVKNMFRRMRKTQASIYAPAKGNNPLFKLFEKISRRTLDLERGKCVVIQIDVY